MSTLKVCCPGWPRFGMRRVSAGPGVTVNALTGASHLAAGRQRHVAGTERRAARNRQHAVA